jgi:hypothetical protein
MKYLVAALLLAALAFFSAASVGCGAGPQIRTVGAGPGPASVQSQWDDLVEAIGAYGAEIMNDIDVVYTEVQPIWDDRIMLGLSYCGGGKDGDIEVWTTTPYVVTHELGHLYLCWYEGDADPDHSSHIWQIVLRLVYGRMS